MFYPSLVALAYAAVAYGTCMPGRSHQGPLPPATDEERALAAELRADVDALAAEGERNVPRPATMERAVTKLDLALRAAGLAPKRHDFAAAGAFGANLDAEVAGARGGREVVVVGAHYDSVPGAPGADDDASGIAAALAIARRFARKPGGRALRVVLFANEEAPYFGTDAHGSLVYARECAARGDAIVAMLSLETMGWFADAPGSQRYPWPFGALYPDRGDFIGFVGDLGSRGLVRDAVGTFRQTTPFPAEGAALPRFVPGVGWSDRWSFWQIGVPAVMVTDTAPFRNPHYHEPSDRPETLDYDRLARVTLGVERVVRHLTDG